MTSLATCSGTPEEAPENQRSPADCEELEEALEGRWRFLSRGDAYDTFFKPNVSPHPDRLEFENGEFTAEYSEAHLEMLRRMMEDPSVPSILRGGYEIVGRTARDLYLVPCSIRMGPGFPGIRSISVSNGQLELGNVGDTWSTEVYRREE